jgi:type VI protein secretion system component VasF
MDTEQKQEQELSARKSSDPAHEKRSLWRRPPIVLAGTVLLGVLLFLGLRYLADGWTHE